MRKLYISNKGIDDTYQLTHLGWGIALVISWLRNGDSSNVPGWAGYNSLLFMSKCLTQVRALPLLPEVAHEWSTLLMVMTQACALKQLAVGDKYLTVITFDMAPYENESSAIDRFSARLERNNPATAW